MAATSEEQWLRDVIEALKPDNSRWPGLWTRLELILDRLDTAETFIRRMDMEYRYQEFISTKGDTNK